MLQYQEGLTEFHHYHLQSNLSEFLFFSISWLEIRVYNELICQSVRHLSGEPICPTKDLDKVGQMSTKIDLYFSQIILSVVILSLGNLNLVWT